MTVGVVKRRGLKPHAQLLLLSTFSNSFDSYFIDQSFLVLFEALASSFFNPVTFRVSSRPFPRSLLILLKLSSDSSPCSSLLKATLHAFRLFRRSRMNKAYKTHEYVREA